MLVALLSNLETGYKDTSDLVPMDLYEGIRKRSREVRMERESLRESLKSMLYDASESENSEVRNVARLIESDLITQKVTKGKVTSIIPFVDYDRLLSQFENIEKLLKVTPLIDNEDAIIALLMDEY